MGASCSKGIAVHPSPLNSGTRRQQQQQQQQNAPPRWTNRGSSSGISAGRSSPLNSHGGRHSGAFFADKCIQVDGRDLLPCGAGGSGSGGSKPMHWRKGDAIGAGSFGAVYLGLNTDTGELLAIKEVTLSVDGSHMKEAVEQLEQELVLLSGLEHPNIVRYLGTSRDENSLYIFLEYVPGGNIASLVARFGPLGESVIRIYTRQLLEGLSYLHAQRTVHRDVKGANLLLEKDGRIKLADFGMAKQMVEQASFTKSFKGSAFWMAPEVIRQQGHGVAADIWSVGCTVLEMATGKPPWSQCTSQVQAIFKIASSQDLPLVPESLSPQASEFILLCLQRDPAARPSAEELLRHPFVALQPDRFIPALQEITAMEGLGPTAGIWNRGGFITFPGGRGGSGSSNSSGGGGGIRRPRLLFGGRGPGAGKQQRLNGSGPGAQGQLDGQQQNRHQQQLSSDGLHLVTPLDDPLQAGDGGGGGMDDERLAELVLGCAVDGGDEERQGRRDAGTSGCGPPGARGSCGGTWGGAGGWRGGGGGGLSEVRMQRLGLGHGGAEDDTQIDFASRPQLFRVRGLLSLPPLRIPQGAELPFARFQALNQSATAQRPATLGTVTSSHA